MLKTLCACRSVGFRMLASTVPKTSVFQRTNRFTSVDIAKISSLRKFSSSSAASAAENEKAPESTPETGMVVEVKPFEFKPSVSEAVTMLRRLAKKLDAGRPDFIPRGNNSMEKIPTPAAGYWRKEGFTSYFVEVEPGPDGKREIEIELKWSDDKAKVAEEASNITLGQLSVLLRTLANALNSGGPRQLLAGPQKIDVPTTFAGAEVSVEYEVEDGTHELEIKVAI